MDEYGAGRIARLHPSDVEGYLENGSIYMFRRRWAQGSVIGNLGFEYRSDKSGIFYLGATYHRPFNASGISRFDIHLFSVHQRARISPSA
ncbi:MAG: hypothetical protein IPJ85_17600 [Flavobacteriales bacterium]|nr:hypothetical protein [Flavobacteriales bacterium]